MARLRRFGKVWYVNWRERGREYTRAISPRKDTAREFKERLESRLRRQKAGLGLGDVTLKEFLDSYLWRQGGRVRAKDLAPSTLERQKQSVAHFQEWLDRTHPLIRRISQLRRSILEEYRSVRAQQVKAKTVNTEMSLLGGAFETAVRAGDLAHSPFRGLRRLKERDSKPVRELNPAEAAALLQAAPKRFRPYLMGYLYTGARRAELFEVRWEDVDLAAGMLVLQNLKTHRDSSDRSRVVPLHPRLLAMLRKVPKIGRGPWFPVPDQTLRNWLLKTAKDAGIQGLSRIHDLRHAFAGALVSSGVDLYTVGRLLGHRDPKTTTRYAHLRPDALRRAVGKLDF